MATWRDQARPIIQRAIRQGRLMGLDGSELRKHVNAYYPFGERAMHPYKVWLDELHKQLQDKSGDDLSRYWTDLIEGKGR